jgi:uncharacterized damage-inducible protein DinB
MSIAQAMLSEFEHEAAVTRKFLERVPADQLTWQPHEKSHTLGELARHIASLPAVLLQMTRTAEGSIPDESELFRKPTSVQEILDVHDRSVEAVRAALPTLSDAHLATNWSAIVGGKPAMTVPKGSVLRIFLLNHWIHHRGQLGVYLRLTGAKVPQSYGPSGDE